MQLGSEGCKKALEEEEPTKVFDGCQLQSSQAVDGQRGNKYTKNMSLATSNNEIRNNMGYVPQLMNPGIIVGQNPMLVSALNQNCISSIPQLFGLSGGNGINTVSPIMMANYGLGAYQNPLPPPPPQMGRSSGGTTSAQSIVCLHNHNEFCCEFLKEQSMIHSQSKGFFSSAEKCSLERWWFWFAELSKLGQQPLALWMYD